MIPGNLKHLKGVWWSSPQPSGVSRSYHLLMLEDRSHLLVRKMTLTTVCLSGEDYHIKELRTLDSYCGLHGDGQPGISMTWHGNNSIFGVEETRNVQIVSLTRK